MIVAVPVETPVIIPEAFTVATAVLLEVHAPPEFPFDVNEVVALTQTLAVPEIVPAFGVGVTVTVTTLEVATAQAPFVTKAR